MALLCHQFHQMRHLFRLMQPNPHPQILNSAFSILNSQFSILNSQRNLTKPKNVAKIIVCCSGFSRLLMVCNMALQGLNSKRPLAAAAIALSITIATAPHAIAAEKLTLKFGPFQQTVKVADVDRYAQTGEVTSELKLFKPFLNNNIRQSLTARVNLEPAIAQKFAADMLKSPSGKKLLETIQPALPGLTPDLIQAGVGIAIQQFKGLDAIGVLKAIPQDTITVDVSQAIGIASKVNWSYWRTQAMSTVLQDNLKVDATAVTVDFDPTAAGKSAVETTTLTRRDEKRQRDIVFDTYRPSQPIADAPLVMLAPGYEADRKFLAYLGQHLASHGFTVVALQHPSAATTQGKITLDQLIPATEFIDRPKDVSFVLDELAKLNQDSPSRFNTQRVSIIGHSLGGYTALALAGGELHLDELRKFCDNSSLLERVPADWLQCNATRLTNQNRVKLRDDRIVQVMALNPAIGQIFGSKGLSQVKIPSLMFSSSEDALAPALSQQFQPFTQLSNSPKYLFTAIGPTHLSISDPDNLTGAIAATTLVAEKRGPAMEPLRNALRGVALAFVQQLTPEAAKFAPILTPGYIQSRSTDTIVLRFNQELPPNITRLFQIAAG
jgi:predicted dienelactone hydrolase